ncbi:hypothetical protein ACFWZ3_09625 [Frateuria sp. GZRR35]|uniref:hypothetical protein n=1 Tax=Frateuria sp. GZRR35 TaxID=3351536 RepID=UPI003EDB8736
MAKPSLAVFGASTDHERTDKVERSCMVADPVQVAANSQAYAAWVQAVGAILALATTIWLNRVDAFERRIDRDARARNAGIFLKPILVGFRKELAEALEQVDGGQSLESVGPMDDDGQGYGFAGIWTPPSKLTDSLPAVAELGSAAKAVQEAYRRMEDLRNAFGKHYIEEIGECHYDDEEMNQASLLMARTCLAAVDAAIEEVDRLYR